MDRTSSKSAWTLIILPLLTSGITGCGKNQGNTEVWSSAFTRAATDTLSRTAPLGDLIRTSGATVEEFKFCVKRLKIKEPGAESQAIDFAPGLIDLGGGQKTKWGDVDLPAGFTLEEIEVEVESKPDLCGVEYSVLFNGQSTSVDVSFKWEFDPPIDLEESGNTVELNLQTVIDTLLEAGEQGTLDQLKEHIEGVTGTGAKG